MPHNKERTKRACGEEFYLKSKPPLSPDPRLFKRVYAYKREKVKSKNKKRKFTTLQSLYTELLPSLQDLLPLLDGRLFKRSHPLH